MYANHRDQDWWDGSLRLTIPAGSFITSQDHLATLSRTSRKTVRLSIDALIRIGSITANIRAKKYTEITLVNSDRYRGTDLDEGQQEGQVGAKQGPSRGQVGAITGEGKKERKKEELHCEAAASQNGNRQTALQILDWLNTKSHRNYRPSDTNLAFITNRLKDGIADWQLRAIVTRKCREWDTDEMRRYLRPATLFNKTKCEQYVGELPREDTPG
jgi:uncharacterized phage protein (TIGR02220 family)